MPITNRPDPTTQIKMINSYMLWALLAAEEVVGKQGMNAVLRDAKLERLIDHYPPDDLTVSAGYTFGDYASLNAALLTFFGRAGKSMALRVGRLSAKYGIEKQGAVFGLTALVASKFLPIPAQIKMGLDTMQSGFRKIWKETGQDVNLRVEDRGNVTAYIDSSDPFSAGKVSDAPMGWIQIGALQEGLKWSTGREFDIKQTACRSMGAPESVWEVSKTPKE